ncbi:hypothetical protein RC74_17780 [Falsihalocynthiibacter arcticus]|uniref:Sulfatase N-terminal domain-containing protein n=2 Tax=Falsihalocynthiibacter arcticus TaxID=1579316 RepID=A0A126V3F0_9RHOB|nr:hypothetical protein RC74_17780 [Falsihalocynthiibacter arcticus]
MTGRHPVRSGTYSVLPPPGGQDGMVPWEYTIAELLSDSDYATALYGKWHLGNVQGRLPNDQGFDEWWGIPNSWDQSGFTSYPMYDLMAKEILAKEGKTELLNVPPHVLEGKKGEESKPAMDLDMKVRPVIDADYLIPKTVAFIKKQAAEDKPFFVYLGYSEMPPRSSVIRPSSARRLSAAGCIPTVSPRWTIVSVRCLMASKKLASKTTPSLF